MAARADQLFEQLARHLSRLVGEVGIMMLFKRAVVLASRRFPWLADASTAALPGPNASFVPPLRAVMAPQDPAAIVDAFAGVLACFVGLLQRMIGEAMVRRLLQEVWPEVFRIEKESP